MNNKAIFTSVAIGLVTVLATASLLDEPSAHDVEQSVQLDLRDAQRQAERVASSPARRQPPYPATLPPDLPVWPDRSQPERRRAVNLAKALTGYAVCILCLMGVGITVAVWHAMATTT